MNNFSNFKVFLLHLLSFFLITGIVLYFTDLKGLITFYAGVFFECFIIFICLRCQQGCDYVLQVSCHYVPDKNINNLT